MKKLIVFITVINLAAVCSAQTLPKEYIQNISRADSLFKAKNYKEAAMQYSLAFKLNNDQGKVRDGYFAASCWARANSSDSSFYQLDRIVKKGKYANYYQLTSDTNFKGLHKDKRWAQLLKDMEINMEEQSEKANAQIKPDED